MGNLKQDKSARDTSCQALGISEDIAGEDHARATALFASNYSSMVDEDLRYVGIL